MKKIKTIFDRDWNGNRQVINKINPGTENFHNDFKNIFTTRKWNGTACMIKDNVLYKRYDAKDKEPPKDFIECEYFDGKHHLGWVKCDLFNPGDKYHFEAFNRNIFELSDIYPNGCYKGFLHGIIQIRNSKNIWLNGTYELIGEKINKNPENVKGHILVYHGVDIIDDLKSIEFNYLKNWFKDKDIEGIVFYDGLKTAKIKKKDFGLKRKG